ncbi:hypothetical protein D3C72_665880 [compost metagenome]
MGTHNYMNSALFQPFQYTAALLCFYRSGEYRYGYRHVFQQIADTLKVLLGQYLSRCHHATLVTIVRCDKHAQQGHHCFATTDISLYQPVHLPSLQGIGPDFFNNPFLRTSQFEGQVIIVECIEEIANRAEHIARLLMVTDISPGNFQLCDQ